MATTSIVASSRLFPPSPAHAQEISYQHHGMPITIPSIQKPRNLTQSFSTSPPQLKCDVNLQTMFPSSPTSHDYAPVIESCMCIHLARQIHAHTFKTGFHGREFLETRLLQAYGRCGSIESASLLFDKMPIRSVYCWAAAITLFSDHELFEEALMLFKQMQVEGTDLEFFIFPVVFKACSGLGYLGMGKQLHGFVTKRQFVSNIYVSNALIDMYGKCGYLDGAKVVLEKMPERDCVSWNCIVTGCAENGMTFEALDFLEQMQFSGVMPNLVSWSAAIGGFAQNGYDQEALELLHRMLAAGTKPNARTLASVLPACARLQVLRIGKEIHGFITRQGYMSNAFVVNGVLDVYRRCGNMDNALKIFLKFSMRNLVSFNTMIVGYCENGEVNEAKELFDQMQCLGIEKDTISWNSMISGYVDNGKFHEALKIFRDMQLQEGVEADAFTLGSILAACADMAAFRQGMEIHSYAIVRGLQSNAFVGGALVEMYCRCGDLAAAQMAFVGTIERDTAVWNALISGYAQHNQMDDVHKLLEKMKLEGLEPNAYTWNGIIMGHLENGYTESALQLFSEMQSANFKPDIYTTGMILHACSSLASIERGKQVHAYSVRHGYDTYVHVAATLVDMYAKCGSIEQALIVFNRISHRNLVSWNSMLSAYAMHGCGKEGITLFHQMLVDQVRPDAVTFLSVLSLCAHLGFVDQGREYFDLMENYDIKPTLKHYTCFVDLLSRAGHLSEAYKLIKKMPVAPDAVVWGSFLSGCVIHSNVRLGEIAATKLIEMEASNTGNYVLLANLYASAGRWDDFARTWQIIKDGGLQKSPGCSWIEDGEQNHVFFATDRSHEKTEEIYAVLESLTFNMRNEGYETEIPLTMIPRQKTEQDMPT